MNLSDYLVLTDMDNTLLRVPHGIPEENIEKINEFGRLGGHIACCTGRSVDAVKHFTDVMRFSAPGITCAGAVIYDFNENRPVFQMTVTENIFPLVKQIMDDFPEVGVEFHNCDGIFSPRVNDLVKSHCADEFITYREVTFEEIEDIAGIPIDHSFLNFKKELTEYGYIVGKISLKEQTVIFNKINK